MNKLSTGALVLLWMVLFGGVPACKQNALNAPKAGAAGGGNNAPAPVKVAGAIQRSVPIQIQNTGTVEARHSVAIRAQVSGEITEVAFREGDFVKKEQILFKIDARPYEVTLAQAEAALSKAKALAVQARAEVERSQIQAKNDKAVLERDAVLLSKKMVSQEEYDSTRTAAEAAKADVVAGEATAKSAVEAVRQAEATVEDARLELAYCTIRSPINGRTGNVTQKAGNIVKANDTAALVTINEIDPIQVAFTIPEKFLPMVRESQAKGDVAVKAIIPGEEDRPVAGKLVFMDNTVSLGTISLKAEFGNADHRLWPGQYVRVWIHISELPNAIVVPSQAIQTGQDGSFVYVVQSAPGKTNPENGASKGNDPALIAVVRKVVPGESVDGFTVVLEGVSLGERVVTDGQIRCMPDGPVRIVTGKDEALPVSPNAGNPASAGQGENVPAQPAAKPGEK